MTTFYYEISNLIDRAQVKCLYFINNVVDKEGNPQFENLSISSIDDSFVRTLLEVAANSIYGSLAPYSRDLDELETPLEGFEFGVDYEGKSDCIVFRIIETEKFDDTVTKPLENSIKEALINYVVREFLYQSNADGSTFKKLYEQNREDILSYINRRINLKRNYKLY